MPCGIIYSAEFAEFLRRKHGAEERAHPGEVLSLEYLRCREGPRAGTAWWQLVWVPLFSAPSEHRFQIGGTEVFIHRQSRRGLMNHLLHYAEGQVVVKG
ncbi:MAG TPA: hypothetical protein VD994_05665 [Prosthecobacter sp.]|nr:hypothetical protein [Prosthecobacter sp.]